MPRRAASCVTRLRPVAVAATAAGSSMHCPLGAAAWAVPGAPPRRPTHRCDQAVDVQPARGLEGGALGLGCWGFLRGGCPGFSLPAPPPPPSPPERHAQAGAAQSQCCADRHAHCDAGGRLAASAAAAAAAGAACTATAVASSPDTAGRGRCARHTRTRRWNVMSIAAHGRARSPRQRARLTGWRGGGEGR